MSLPTRCAGMMLALSFASLAPAGDLIFRDYFSYSDGALDAQGGWTNTSQITIATDAAEHSGAGNGPGNVFNARQDIAPQGAAGSELWIALWAQQLIDEPEINSFGGLGLFDGTVERLLVGKAWGQTDVWALAKPSSVPSLSTEDASTGTNSFIIVRITYGLFTDIADMWVNPINPAFLGDPDASEVGDFAFDNITLRSGNNGDCRFSFDGVALDDVLTDGVTDIEPRPRPEPCVGDTNLNGEVNFTDLLAVLNDWGICSGCSSDVDEDGMVGFDDLLTVLNNWGPCP